MKTTRGHDTEYNERDGVVSLHGNKRIPTGRKTRRITGYGKTLGEINPPNTNLMKLVDGDMSIIKEMDDEELSAGVPKCDDGKFAARAAQQANMMPDKIKREISKELFRRADVKLKGAQLDAINSLIEIATQPGSEDKDRIKAATWIIERVQGKTPDVVQHVQDKPWQLVLQGIATAARDVTPELDNVLEGEVVDED